MRRLLHPQVGGAVEPGDKVTMHYLMGMVTQITK